MTEHLALMDAASSRDRADDDLYDAFFAGAAAPGVMVGVTSTGIFCRSGCPARAPKRENCVFFDGAQAALMAGFRACKRCHPMGQTDGACLRRLIDLVETQDRVSEADLRQAGYDPKTVRRQFKTRLGLSFSDYARLRRLGRAQASLSQGGSVIEAQLEAGFESASGFRNAFAKTFGAAPKSGAPDPLRVEWIDTPMGRMVAVTDDAALYLLEFVDRVRLKRQFERLRRVHGRAVVPGRTRVTDQIEAELSDYFAGQLKAFQTPLIATGTDFQDGVWAALQTIPYGQTWSYADLARAIGNEKAVRAVASANGSNGLALIIPCHRVIGSDGGLGGYAGGVPRKRALLALEAAHC